MASFREKKVTQEHLAAIEYVFRGFPVVLTKHREKRPDTRVCPQGSASPLATPEAVEDAFRRAPGSGVAIVIPSHILCLDVDGPDGRASMLRLKEQHGPLPKTWTVRSGGGGWHAYFCKPRGFKAKARVRPGLEVKPPGTMIHAPPTVHVSGVRYKWVIGPKDVPAIPAAPEWLLMTVKAPEDRPVHDARPAPPSAVDQARAYVAGCAPAISGSGGQMQTISVVAKVARGFGLGEDQALDVLAPWNERCCPPWSQKELRRKVRDVLQGGTGVGFGELVRRAS